MITQDSTYDVRNLDILVGYVTSAGLKVAQFKNDAGRVYLTRVNVTTDTGDCECESFEHGQICYHMIALAALTEYELVTGVAPRVAAPTPVVAPTVASRDLGERGSLGQTKQNAAVSTWGMIADFRKSA